MYHIIIYISILLLGVTGPAASSSAEPMFSDSLTSIISRYEKTENIILPPVERAVNPYEKISNRPGRVSAGRNIVINKRLTRLYVLNHFGDTLATFPVCCSMNRGQKHYKDDCRTPEGTFTVAGIYNSTDWKYKGTGAKCYGPFYVSLITPGFWGIGIHGTNAPSSIPGRRSHGCIRMLNEHISILRTMVDRNTTITILSDDPEIEQQQLDELHQSFIQPANVPIV